MKKFNICSKKYHSYLYNKADLDDDGFVTFDDFYNLMTQKEYGKQWNMIIKKIYELFNIS